MDRVKSIFTKSIDHTEKIDLIEERLLTSDVGIYTTEIVLAHLNSLHKSNVDIDLINESKSFLFELLNQFYSDRKHLIKMLSGKFEEPDFNQCYIDAKK